MEKPEEREGPAWEMSFFREGSSPRDLKIEKFSVLGRQRFPIVGRAFQKTTHPTKPSMLVPGPML